jgi:hypothetical protein
MNWIIVAVAFVVNDVLLIALLGASKQISSPIRFSVNRSTWTKTLYGITIWLGNRGKTILFRNYQKLSDHDSAVFSYFSHGTCTVVGIDIAKEYKKHRREINRKIKEDSNAE